MNRNSDYEEPVRSRADESAHESQPSQRKSSHLAESIERNLDLSRTWIKKLTDIASDGKSLVFTVTFLASSVLVSAHVLLREFEPLKTIANEIVNLNLGPERPALVQTLNPPTPNQIENESALLSLIRSSLTQGLSSYPRTKEKQSPLISKTTNSRRLPLIAKAQPTQLPPGTFKLGRPMGFDRDRNGKLLAFEQSSRTISSFSGNIPAGRR
ncbi:MAG TPA: hypothetical protein VE969_01540 [Pyrinomonadaceae bacterium]|jgi:hypothetical protein|nr:hypothetical protein [Pyrinomonadaceae bacterium]